MPLRFLSGQAPIQFASIIAAWALTAGGTLCQEVPIQSQTAPPAAEPRNWAHAMFPRLGHDFGMVVRGPLLEHRFPVQNVYGEKVHIGGVRSSCGCTNLQATKQELLPGEKAEIIVLLDTRKAAGHEDATVTVTFDVPFPAEVRLRIRSTIRTDLVLEPGIINFGSVPLGEGARQKGRLTYSGPAGWRITGVDRVNPAIEVRVKEAGRQPERVDYEVRVDLKKDAPAGFFREFIPLVTNDPNPALARVMLVAEGFVTPEVSVHPISLALGSVEAGQSVARNLVIQARRPLRVTAIQGPDSRFESTLPADSKSLHVVPIRFRADQPLGPVAGQITIQTDYPGFEKLVVTVAGEVIAAGNGKR
jgi:hypothetical protein